MFYGILKICTDKKSSLRIENLVSKIAGSAKYSLTNCAVNLIVNEKMTLIILEKIKRF